MSLYLTADLDLQGLATVLCGAADQWPLVTGANLSAFRTWRIRVDPISRSSAGRAGLGFARQHLEGDERYNIRRIVVSPSAGESPLKGGIACLNALPRRPQT
jgi:hypothetical protein